MRVETQHPAQEEGVRTLELNSASTEGALGQKLLRPEITDGERMDVTAFGQISQSVSAPV